MAKFRKMKMTPRSARRVIARGARNWKSKKMTGSFAKRVQRVVDRSLKNTPTPSVRVTGAIGTVVPPGSGGISWFSWQPGTQTFPRNPVSGTAFPMEGDSLKIKKWWIKGTIQPTLNNLIMTQSLVGYVDVYLARFRASQLGIPASVGGWYLDGNVVRDPVGALNEMLLPLNHNEYKVYAHRRMKVGQSAVPGSSSYPSNNDFALAKSFSFDVTKYVMKNRRLRFSGTAANASDVDLSSLSLVILFHPAIGNLPLNSPPGGAEVTYYECEAVSYGEYETA